MLLVLWSARQGLLLRQEQLPWRQAWLQGWPLGPEPALSMLPLPRQRLKAWQCRYRRNQSASTIVLLSSIHI